MKNGFWLMAAMLLLFSCNDTVTSSDSINSNRYTCQVLNPLEDLPWLKEKVNQMKEYDSSGFFYFVTQAQYNGQTIFAFSHTKPTAFTEVVYYNCQGEQICSNFTDCNHVVHNVQDIKVLWRSNKKIAMSR